MNDNIGIESVRRSIEDKLLVQAVIFLAGYVGSGKTFILEELKKRSDKNSLNAEYHDIRAMSADESDRLRRRVLESIQGGENVLFLLDNVTYFKHCDWVVQEICEAYGRTQTAARVVLAGDRFLLRYWAGKFLCDEEGYVGLDYDDSADEPYGIRDLNAYLNGCLEIAKAADEHSVHIVYNNEYSGLNAEMLTDAMYSVLLNTCGYSSGTALCSVQLAEPSALNEPAALTDKLVRGRINACMQERHERFMQLSCDEFRKALIFLWRSGIVEFENTAESNAVRAMLNSCISSSADADYRLQYFRDFTVRLTHPLFVSALIGRIIP